MDIRGYQNYKEQSVSTMTPGELLLLLYDELVKRAMRAQLALEKKDYPLFEQSVDRCIDIVRYLDDTLDLRYEVSAGLHRLYDYFMYELGRVKIGRNGELLSQIKPNLVELRDTFRIAVNSAPTGR